MAPWIPPIVEFLQTIAPIAGAVASIILAVLYYFQFDTLEEQRKLSRANQCPYLTGPYNVSYDLDDDILDMYVSNAGNGPAKNVRICTRLELFDYDGSELEGGGVRLPTGREDAFNTIEPNDIQPQESNVQLLTDRVEFACTDPSTDFTGEDYLDIEGMLSVLRKHNVEVVYVSLLVKYTDKFGGVEDPFGREYVLQGPSIAFPPDHLDHESVLHSFSGDHSVGGSE